MLFAVQANSILHDINPGQNEQKILKSPKDTENIKMNENLWYLSRN